MDCKREPAPPWRGGYGHGLGYEYGYGYGYGHGYGLGLGYGHGLGYGYGHGLGLGCSHGHGLGYGHGHGLGYGLGLGLGLGLGYGHGLGLGYGYGYGYGHGHGHGLGSGDHRRTPYDERVNPWTDRSSWPAVALWLGAATAVWLAAALVDRRTEVTVDAVGSRLRFTVAGTEVVLGDTIRSLDGITLDAADAVQTPHLVHWELETDRRVAQLPTGRGRPPSSPARAPVGDWWVDHRIPTAAIAGHDKAVDGPFTIRAVLLGRFSRETTFRIHGEPSVDLAFRRGVKDNYLVVRDGDGRLIEVTTLDPTPAADLGALVAQLLRGVSAAAVVIAFVGLVAALARVRRAARAGRRTSAPRDGKSSRPELISALGLACLAALVSAWVAVDVLGGLPHQIDEVVSLLQARWLLDGDVAPAATAIQDHLRIPFTYVVEDRWIGHYPIGWPALLAVGLMVGAPHLVNPVLGAVLVVLVFLAGRELDDELTGIAAAALATASPLLRLLSGSMFPHLACAVLVSLALWLLLLAQRRRDWWWGAGAGAALGCCLAVRPLPAVAAAVVLGAWLVVRATRGGDRPAARIAIAAATIGGLAASLPTFAHNAATTGHPLTLPYSLTAGTMYAPELAPFGLRNLDAILVALSASLHGWGWPLLTGELALALPLGVMALPFVLRRARTADWLLLAILIAVAVGHLSTRAHGLHGYGARYAVDVAGFLVLLSARGLRELGRWARPSPTAVRAVAGVVLALVAGTVLTLPWRLGLYRGYYGVTGALERQLEATGLERAVILVDDGPWQPWGEAARLMTGPRRHDIAVGADLGDASVIEKVYPDRFVLRWDGDSLHRDHGADR